MIKNIVFDFGNVIVKWDISSILEKYEVTDLEAGMLKEVIFESEEWLQLDKGILNAEQAEKIFRDRVPEHLKKQVSEIMDTWFEKMEFNIEVCRLIKKLKWNGYKIYGLSNTNIQFYEHIKESDIGSYFDGFLISAVEKMLKPDKEIFDRLVEKFSLNPQECFFIDDTEQNIIAGRECGMQGFVFNMNHYQELEKELYGLRVNYKMDLNCKIAELELEKAEKSNPGSWADHSRYVALACRNIARHCKGLSADKAYILGLLHDIGRYAGVSSEKHLIDGYHYCMERGWEKAAQICISHAFMIQDIHTSIGTFDISDEEYQFMEKFVKNAVYDDYDRLVQLCDALALPTGFCMLEKRFVDVTIRYGVHASTIDRWKKIMEIKDMFEERIGFSIYHLLPGVIENSFSLEAGSIRVVNKNRHFHRSGMDCLER